MTQKGAVLTYSLRNDPEERSTHLLRGESLKSLMLGERGRMVVTLLTIKVPLPKEAEWLSRFWLSKFLYQKRQNGCHASDYQSSFTERGRMVVTLLTIKVPLPKEAELLSRFWLSKFLYRKRQNGCHASDYQSSFTENTGSKTTKSLRWKLFPYRNLRPSTTCNRSHYVYVYVWLPWLRFFPCFFLSCKANARVKPAKTGHGPQSS